MGLVGSFHGRRINKYGWVCISVCVYTYLECGALDAVLGQCFLVRVRHLRACIVSCGGHIYYMLGRDRSTQTCRRRRCRHTRIEAGKRTDGGVHQRGEAPRGSVVAREDAVELLVAREVQERGATERGAAEADGREVLVLLLFWIVGFGGGWGFGALEVGGVGGRERPAHVHACTSIGERQRKRTWCVMEQ